MRRWFETVRLFVLSPARLAAGVPDATADGGIRFLLLSSILASPFEPVAHTLAGEPSERALTIQLTSAAISDPIRNLLSALIFSAIYWISGRLLGGVATFGLALRAYAFSIGGTAVVMASSNLLLFVDSMVGLVAVFGLTIWMVVLQWKVLRHVAQAGFHLDPVRSRVAASIPYALIVLFVGALFLIGLTRRLMAS